MLSPALFVADQLLDSDPQKAVSLAYKMRSPELFSPRSRRSALRI